MKREALIRNYFQMANDEDVEGMFNMYAPGGTFNPPGRPPLQGEAIKEYLSSVPMAYEYHHDTPLRIWEVDNFNFIEIRGEIKTAEGASTSFLSLEIMEFDENDKLLSVAPYWDNYKIMRDLGFMKRNH